MATHTITNTIITGGYNLSSAYSTLSIASTGEITGGSVGVFCANAATIINRGSIINSSADGVQLNAGGSLTNGSTLFNHALIQSSGVGVYVNSASVTVTNFATISGATAVKFKFASDTLVVEAGSSLIGAVQGGGGSLQLTPGTGTLSNLGTSFSGFGSYSVASGGSWTLSGTNTLGAKTTLTNKGTLTVGGTLNDSGSVTNGGIVSAAPGATGKAGGTAVGLTGGALVKGSITAGGALTNTAGTITGGAGGAGAAGGAAVNGTYAALSNYAAGLIMGGLGGAGGVGGAGVGVALLTNNGTIIGGVGGNGASYSASGGAGGIGARISQYGSATIRGTITGGTGGSGGGAPNTGGAGGVGIFLGSHASVTNAAQGTITGGAGGSFGGVGGAGAYLASQATLTNAAQGTITAGAGAIAGVVVAGGATLLNIGTISGGTYSVDITGPGGVLMAQPGSVLNGSVKGGGGTLELTGGIGTISGLGATGTISVAEAMTFSGFGAYQIDAGYWNLVGTNTVGAGITLTDNARIISTGTLALYGAVGGTGTLDIYGGSATIGATAAVTVANLGIDAGTLRLNQSLTNNGNFYEGVEGTLILGSNDQLQLTGTTKMHGLIDGAGTVTVSYGTVSEMTIGSTDVLIDAGNVTGGALSIAGRLQIQPGATWTILTNSNFLHGSANSGITVAGTLTSSLSAHSSIESPIVVTGLIEAQSGTLNLFGSVTGTGVLQVDPGAFLEVNSTVAPTVSANLKAGAAGQISTFTLDNQTAFAGTITCLGGYDEIDITPNAEFAGVIKGFGANDAIDLLGVVATSASINANNQLVVVYQNNGTTTPIVTLQMSSRYAGEVFTVHAHKSGYAYSTITMSPGTPQTIQTETISSTHAGGINLNAKYNMLSVTNTGVIDGGGGAYGLLSAYGATIVNNGKIFHDAQYGVNLQSQTYLTNGSATNPTAYIQSSGIGIYARHAFVTVTNFGTIAGGSGVALKFAFARDRLIVEAGSKFVGAVQGGGGTLELASGKGTIKNLGVTGTISGSEAVTFSGFGGYQLDAGTNWTLAGNDTIAAGVTLASAGVLKVSGKVAINGTLNIDAGVATIAGSGTVANLSLDGGITNLNRSLTIAGANAFSEGSAATLALGKGIALSVTGVTTLQGLITGAGSVTLANGGRVGSLALSGGATLVVSGGTVSENGAISVGGGTASVASLIVGQNATWIIGYGLDLQHGSSTSFMEIDGRLVGSCLNGTQPEKSEIACPISVTSTGTIEAQAGPLIFNGSVTGTGVVQIDGGATLTVNASLGSTMKANLNAGTLAAPANLTLGFYASFGGAITCRGAYDTIALNPYAVFSGTITGFGANDTIVLDPKAFFTGVIAGFGLGGTIDLLKTAATGASINAKDQLVIVNGTTTVATLQLTGTYSAPTFKISTDGAGGTNVTLLTAASTIPPGAPPGNPPGGASAVSSSAPSVQAMVAAMAGLGPRTGSMVTPSAHDEARPPTLLGPRPQLN